MNKANAIPKQEELKAQTYFCTAIPVDLGKTIMTQGVVDILENNIGSQGSLFIALTRYKNGGVGLYLY
ncbi:hypothetical protein VoSk93_51330 [Vibrio owensii]